MSNQVGKVETGGIGTQWLQDLRGESPPPRPILPSPLSGDALIERSANLLGLTKLPTWTIVAELSARHPYDVNGAMSWYRPEEWDIKFNYVHVSGDSQGTPPGQSRGTVGLVDFFTPAQAWYLIAVQFSGHKVTMRTSGPMGVHDAHTDTTQDNGVILFNWSAKAGDESLYFSIDCVGDEPGAVGYLQSVQLLDLELP